MDVLDAIRARRSVKAFTSEPVDPGDLDRLLELAVLAPNHRMTEPWRFIVLGPEARRAYGRVKGEERAARVDDPEVGRQVLKRTLRDMEALPAMVAFVQVLDPDPEVREEDFASVYMAMQNVLVAAPALGLGTHVKTGAVLDSPRAREVTGVAENERLVALVHIGVPERQPDARPRTPARELTRELT